MPALRRWLAGLLLTSLAACARPDIPPPNAAAGIPLSPSVLLTSVPFHPQTERDDCGPAALAMMLGWSGVETDPARLAPQVYTPGRSGTLQADIVQAARRAGRIALRVRSFDDLLAELDAGNPVIVLQNIGLVPWPTWHYAVAIGYDLSAATLLLHSGKTERLAIPFDVFDGTWQSSERWALTVTPPDRLPARVGLDDALEAANGLEQAGEVDAAALAYGALLDRWPDNLATLMGFGNARYAAGDHEAASQAFRHAVVLHPEAAEAWNNLAVSLAAEGRHGHAMEAAREAVRLGGPHLAAAKETLSELEAKDR